MEMTIKLSTEEVKVAVKQYIERTGVHVADEVTLESKIKYNYSGYGPNESRSASAEFDGASAVVTTSVVDKYFDPSDCVFKNPSDFIPGEQ